MADDLNQTKTEEPTPRRRDEARKKGQFANSGDLSSGLLLLGGLLIIWLGGGAFARTLLATTKEALLRVSRIDWDVHDTFSLMSNVLADLLHICGGLLAALFILGVLVGAMQSGFHLTLEPLKPDWEKLSLANGWGRLFSTRSTVRGIMSILKVAAVSLLLWWILKGELDRVALAGRGSLGQAAAIGWELAMHAALAVAAALVLIGLSDYLFQRWRHEQDLKMSIKEIRDEHKQEEGDPHLRARIKKLQREVFQRRMIQDVPKATVVLTNPTHIAVALQYDRAEMEAPKLIAKGTGLIAKRIVKVANEHDIPVLERKPLARALYSAVNVGSEIPIELYRAIAEILAYVYRLKRAA